MRVLVPITSRARKKILDKEINWNMRHYQNYLWLKSRISDELTYI